MHNEAIKMAKWAMNDACAKGYDNMTSQDWDDFKDCVETAKNAIKCDYYYRLVECMKKDEEEEKRKDKYFIDMLKEEYSDEYKRMREEYGDDEGERRFYDSYRYKSTGRFAPKGRGSYVPRRGYEEPPYYHMMPRDDIFASGYDRDLDLKDGRMSTGVKATRFGYSHDKFMEEKKQHPGQTEAEKKMRMRKLNERLDDLKEMGKETVAGMTPEERQAWKIALNELINM